MPCVKALHPASYDRTATVTTKAADKQAHTGLLIGICFKTGRSMQPLTLWPSAHHLHLSLPSPQQPLQLVWHVMQRFSSFFSQQLVAQLFPHEPSSCWGQRQQCKQGKGRGEVRHKNTQYAAAAGVWDLTYRHAIHMTCHADGHMEKPVYELATMSSAACLWAAIIHDDKHCCTQNCDRKPQAGRVRAHCMDEPRQHTPFCTGGHRRPCHP